MLRYVVAAILTCVTASAAAARDVCIQFDGGPYAGSQLVLKKSRLTPRSVAPLQGYLARYSAGAGGFIAFTPIAGGSIASSAGAAVLTLTVHDAYAGITGYGSGSNPPTAVSIGCLTGADGRFNALDQCNARVNGASVVAHLVDCGPETKVP